MGALLVGTTDEDFTGDPTDVRASAAEIAYLCTSASAYLREPVTPEMVVWSYSGVRPLYDDGTSAPHRASCSPGTTGWESLRPACGTDTHDSPALTLP